MTELDTPTPRATRPVFVAGSPRRHRAVTTAGAAVGLGLVAYLVLLVAALLGAGWVPDVGLPAPEAPDDQTATGGGIAPLEVVAPATTPTTEATNPAPSTTAVTSEAADAATASTPPAGAVTPPTAPPVVTPPPATPPPATSVPPPSGPPSTLPDTGQGSPPADPGRPDTTGRPADPGSNGRGTTRNPTTTG